MALGGVDTGSMKAQLAPNPAGITNHIGSISSAGAKAAKIGMSVAAVERAQDPRLARRGVDGNAAAHARPEEGDATRIHTALHEKLVGAQRVLPHRAEVFGVA